VTPETGYFLDKARRVLMEADSILAINIHDVAGRMAYLAGFHAAQAFICERTGRSVKTHKGVHGQLYRLTKDAAGFDRDLRTFLSETYDLKNVADYEIGPGPKYRRNGRVRRLNRPSASSPISRPYWAHHRAVMTQRVDPA
jgi:uncharacterized protein (UPF0332 family)